MKLPLQIVSMRIVYSTMLIMLSLTIHGQELPLGYISYYNQNCSDTKFQKSLALSSPEGWNVSKYKCTLISPIERDSSNVSLFPENQGIIPDLLLGEYIMEFEFKLLDSCTSDSSGFYLMSPIKECSNYYAFGFTHDSLVFYYPKELTVSKVNAQAHGLDLYQWTKVRVTRNILKRTLRFQFMGNEQSDLLFRDKRLIMGYIGFGTQDVNSAIRNVRIWAPTAFQDQYYRCE